MVLATTHCHRVLLRAAQARQGFAGIENARLRTGHGLDKRRRPGGDSGHHLQEVQRRTLSRQQRTRAAGDFTQLHTGGDGLAVLDMPEQFAIRVQFGKTALKPFAAGDHAVLSGDDAGVAAGGGGNQQGGQVATLYIFGQRAGDVLGNDGF